jgi:hypothetical protein
MNFTDPQLKLITQVIREYELKKLRASSDEKGPAVKRGEGAHLVRLPLTVVRFDSSEPTAS